MEARPPTYCRRPSCSISLPLPACLPLHWSSLQCPFACLLTAAMGWMTYHSGKAQTFLYFKFDAEILHDTFTWFYFFLYKLDVQIDNVRAALNWTCHSCLQLGGTNWWNWGGELCNLPEEKHTRSYFVEDVSPSGDLMHSAVSVVSDVRQRRKQIYQMVQNLQNQWGWFRLGDSVLIFQLISDKSRNIAQHTEKRWFCFSCISLGFIDLLCVPTDTISTDSKACDKKINLLKICN